MIIKGRDEFLANRLFEQYHVVDILDELEDLSDENLFKFLRLCKDVNVAEIFEVCDEEFAVRISKSFNDFQLIEIFSHMKNSDVADLLGYLPTVRRKEILKIMKTSDSNILKMILSFDEDTAGGIMSTNFISLRENLTAQDALNKIKQISPETEIIDEIFITDYMHRLKGYVTLRTILTADDAKNAVSRFMISHGNLDFTDFTIPESRSSFPTPCIASISSFNSSSITGIISSDVITPRIALF